MITDTPRDREREKSTVNSNRDQDAGAAALNKSAFCIFYFYFAITLSVANLLLSQKTKCRTLCKTTDAKAERPKKKRDRKILLRHRIAVKSHKFYQRFLLGLNRFTFTPAY